MRKQTVARMLVSQEKIPMGSLDQKWANAVLKDGKILFWWSGGRCASIYDFAKDFYFAGFDMKDMEAELQSGRYNLVTAPISQIGYDDVMFYRNFLIHDDFQGTSPHTAKM